jgi:hypothetical protein
MTPEEQGVALAQAVYKERQDALADLAKELEAKGKLPHEYIICDNFSEVLDGLDRGEVITFSCWAVPKLSANLFI